MDHRIGINAQYRLLGHHPRHPPTGRARTDRDRATTLCDDRRLSRRSSSLATAHI